MELQGSDLKLLRIFMTVAECGGFSAAQAALNVSQSSISEQMGHLETRLGVKLCERGRGGFRLTEQGVATLDATNRLMAALKVFGSENETLKQRVSGRLGLGLIDNTISDEGSPLPEAIRKFLSRGHDVYLDIYIGTPAELETRVLDGRLNVAIGPFPMQVPGLSYSTLYFESMGLYCSPASPLCNPSLREAELFKTIASSKVVEWPYWRRRNLEILRVVEAAATVANVEAQAILILSGSYIGFLPLHYAMKWVDAGQMCQVAPDRFHFDSPFTAVTQRSARLPSILQVFMEDLNP
jgi:DNA-binding transcriptional LysR family regulator